METTSLVVNEQNNSDNGNDSEDAFLCSVCLECVKDRDPVVTQCGHLYCWPCLFRWLNSNHTTCPVCKAGVTKENVIPIFIKGSVVDPRTKTSTISEQIPNRPLGHRPVPQAGNPLLGPNNMFGGVSFSPSIGYFPSLFGLQFQRFTSSSTPPSQADADEAAQTLYLSRILQFLMVCVVLCLLLF
jgi:E3 ubiquitin-protein ligase RNF5